MMIVSKPAGNSGLGVDYLDGLPRRRVIVASLLTVIAAGAVFGLAAVPIVLAACGAGALVVQLANAKIGGISGDVLGAVQQIAKITTLVGVVIADQTIDDFTILFLD
jgi:adenosylcobinamide-GDP ribazoletransferase